MTGIDFTVSFSAGRKLLHEIETHGRFAFVTMMTLPSLQTSFIRGTTFSVSTLSSLRVLWSSFSAHFPLALKVECCRRYVEGQSVSSQSNMMMVWSGLAYSTWLFMLDSGDRRLFMFDTDMESRGSTSSVLLTSDEVDENSPERTSCLPSTQRLRWHSRARSFRSFASLDSPTSDSDLGLGAPTRSRSRALAQEHPMAPCLRCSPARAHGPCYLDRMVCRSSSGAAGA
mmetsp:Transcript_41921/g.118533  ORF Transcript_41921/g.118533 Transcript_41921/m.118533 type:complete len:228 (+) Transcript_41921:526-1209(+)